MTTYLDRNISLYSVFHLCIMAPALLSKHECCILFSVLFFLTNTLLLSLRLLPFLLSSFSVHLPHHHLVPLHFSSSFLSPILVPCSYTSTSVFLSFISHLSFLTSVSSPTPPSCLSLSLLRWTLWITSPPPTLHPGKMTLSPTSSPARVPPPWLVRWNP